MMSGRGEKCSSVFLILWGFIYDNSDTGDWFSIKVSPYQYRKSHCGDKMILWSSYLHNGISYTSKTSSLYILIQSSDCMDFMASQCVGVNKNFMGCVSISQTLVRHLTHWDQNKNSHFTYNTYKFMFLYENCCILIPNSLKFVAKGPMNNEPALVEIMAWHQTDDKPLSEPMSIHKPRHKGPLLLTWFNFDPSIDK